MWTSHSNQNVKSNKTIINKTIDNFFFRLRTVRCKIYLKIFRYFRIKDFDLNVMFSWNWMHTL